MDNKLHDVIAFIGREYGEKIEKGSRHYLEVSIGRQADRLGLSELGKRYAKTFAIVPLKGPEPGMKVRIDGRTFVNYAEAPSGVAIPGFIAKAAGGQQFTTFIPNDSMICNFT